ncbi:hypothetical protein CYMTET_14412 [Cymbomonas tetramitiformis]|uniref:Uncharacterized protein n=1 Tax=Cymbomonas tetramitiformis TaxID=36881 RepID=A0AAE0GG51_9CHLO|nr:hypothetical protein CYMTET_14412 [Cymbomonas tetramitiformis]
MPRQVTAREFYAEALLNLRVVVPAGCFNAEWNKASVRAKLNIPACFEGTVTAYFKGTGAASTDRWKVVYDDGDETAPADEEPKLPHVSLAFLKSYLTVTLPEVPGPITSPQPLALTSNDEKAAESLDGDIDTDDEDAEGNSDAESEQAEVQASSDEEEEHEFTGFSSQPQLFKWSKEEDEVSEDQRLKDGVGLDLKPPKLNWDASELDSAEMDTSVLKYFLLFLPILLLNLWVAAIQRRGTAKYGDIFLTGKRSLSRGLLLAWLGI